MKAGNRSLRKRIANVRPRAWLKVFVVACAIGFFWYPKRMDRLYQAIPAGATLASCHNGLAREWKGLVNNETILEMLKGFGLLDAEELKNNSGIYQTIYWLTGRHTVAGFVPQASYGETRGYLAASSYVGWKAKIMELLWRIKWVPGLGRMQATPNGTRYLVFEDLLDLDGYQLFLGLDIEGGILVATLSRDPETVRELSQRILKSGKHDLLAAAYGGKEPWKVKSNAPHRLWVSERELLGDYGFVTAEVSTLREPDFSIFVSGAFEVPELEGVRRFGDYAGDAAPSADVPDSAATLLVAFDSGIMASLVRDAPSAESYVPPLGEGLGVAYLSGKPYSGRLVGLAYPALNAALPWSPRDDFRKWAAGWIRNLEAEAPDARIRSLSVSENGIDSFHVFSSHLDFLTQAQARDMAFMELRGGRLRLGSYYDSYHRQREDFAKAKGVRSLADSVAAWQREHPDAFLAIRMDMPAVAQEFAHFAGIARMVANMTPGVEGVGETVAQIQTTSWVLNALKPLGDVECIASAKDSGLKTFRITTKARRR